jgi:hypothetical protein
VCIRPWSSRPRSTAVAAMGTQIGACTTLVEHLEGDGPTIFAYARKSKAWFQSISTALPGRSFEGMGQDEEPGPSRCAARQRDVRAGTATRAVAFIARRRWTNSCAPNPTNRGSSGGAALPACSMDERERRRFLELVDRVLLHLKNGIPPERTCLDELRELLSELKREHALAATEKTKQAN